MNRTGILLAWGCVALAGIVGGGASVIAQPTDPTPPLERSAVTQPAPMRQNLRQLVAIGGDAVVAANQVADDVVVIHGTATIEGEVDGDVVVVLGTAIIKGRVRGEVVVVMGDADINGTVSRDLTLVLTGAALGSEAHVGGKMTAVGEPPLVDPGATFKREPEIISLGPLTGYIALAKEYLFQGVFLLRPFPPRLGWVWVIAGLCLLFHLAVAVVFPRSLLGCMQTLREQPARSFLIGLLACVLVAPVSLLLSFTMVATPLIWLAFFALCVFGRVAAYGSAGAAVGRASGMPALEHPFLAVLVGSIFFYVSYMVPLIGFAVYWLVLPWGVGAALIRLFEALRRERRPSLGSPTVPRGPFGGLAAAGGLSTGAPGPATHAFSNQPPLPPVDVTPPPVSNVSLPPEPPPSAAPAFVPLAVTDLGAAPRIGFWPRFGALVIDLIVVGFLNMVTIGEVKSFWLLLGAYHLGMWGWRATTLGGAVLGLRIVRVDGRPLDWQTAAVRVLGSLVSLLPLGLGFIWVAWDDQYQSWHDRIAGTTIVRADRRMALV